MMRRDPSPFANQAQSAMTSPVSSAAPTPYELNMTASTLNSPITFNSEVRRASCAPYSRSRSVGPIRGHSRANSAPVIDDSFNPRFAYPSYRATEYMPPATTMQQPNLSLVTSLPAAYSQVQDVSYTSSSNSVSDFSPIPEYSPAPEVQPYIPELGYETPTNTLMDYLTASNPSPALVRRLTTPPRGTSTHYWWDIRNLRAWTDFSVPKIAALPQMLPLLEVPVPTTSLPEPVRPANIQPETESALQDIYAHHYVSKINSALAIAQGSSHMTMRAVKPAPGSNTTPHFISNYASDFDKTLTGESRGRVVGLVKCYDQWNTGMRSGSAPKQVLYLAGLAHLQSVMRAHGCRYGFIMTEIELLCVRAGGLTSTMTPDPSLSNATTGTPVFGFLEVSAPISLSTFDVDEETGEIQMTAGLALWYLHMLAKENPFEGMGSWKMEVGGPAALTRQNVIPRDSWMPKVGLGESREAKRIRGWVWPEEPLNKKELGGRKRARSQG